MILQGSLIKSLFRQESISESEVINLNNVFIGNKSFKEMSLLCAECENPVKNPGASIALGSKVKEDVKEAFGYVICLEHIEPLREKLGKLESLQEGPIIVIDERVGQTNPSNSLQWSSPPERTRILGYLSTKEAQEYLPQSYQRALNSVINLAIVNSSKK